jgi:antitoxin CptB
MKAGIDSTAPGRIYWQCRRGMRELDLLLQDFLEHGYPSLDEKGRTNFLVLLECPDALLFDYLMGGIVPSDPALADVVRRVRDAAAS